MLAKIFLCDHVMSIFLILSGPNCEIRGEEFLTLYSQRPASKLRVYLP